MTSRDPLSAAIGLGELVVHVLGSGSGLPTAQRDTCGLLIGADDGWSLVECPGSIVFKLAGVGLMPSDLRRVILTHNHVDHLYGFPHLIQAMAIAGTPASFELMAPGQTLESVHAMVRTHGLDDEHHPQLEMIEIDLRRGAEPLPVPGVRARAVATAHSRDTAALRFESDEASVCYSSDTRPCEALVQLAGGADLLFHDCGGPHRLRDAFSEGHSSALEAAQVASQAGAGRLILMHLGSRSDDELRECAQEAAAAFEGPVTLAEDGMTWTVPGRAVHQ